MKPLPSRTSFLSNSKNLWVVAYVNQPGGRPIDQLVDEAARDIDASLEGGADAVILINEWCSLSELEQTLAGVRKKYPRAPLGVNYLGDDSEPYGYRDSFRLARDYGLQVVWTDFSGVDRIVEKPPVDLHAIETERARGGEFFYASGIHMKYSTLLDPHKTIERSAQQAMGWVDGIIVTGPKTGVPVSPELARRARAVIGDYPLGVASGVTPENAHEIRDLMDFYLVASSLQVIEPDGSKRIAREKVRALRNALTA